MSGNLFIVSAPSGAGKSSLVAALLAAEPSVRLSVSYTTRPPRAGEVEGRDYRFVDRQEFERMRSRGDFLESAEVYGNLYGTSRRVIEDSLASAHDVVLEIDWQGAAQVRRVFERALGIFILPPSIAVLKARLETRAQDSPEVIARRLAAARDDISHVHEFDYVIINLDFSEAVRDLTGIVRAARCRGPGQLERQSELLRQLVEP